MNTARIAAFVTLSGLLAGLGLFLGLGLLPDLRGGEAAGWLASTAAPAALARELLAGAAMAWLLHRCRAAESAAA